MWEFTSQVKGPEAEFGWFDSKLDLAVASILVKLDIAVHVDDLQGHSHYFANLAYDHKLYIGYIDRFGSLLNRIHRLV